MKKIICSAASFARFLERFIVNVPNYDKDEVVIISAQGHKLAIGELSIDVESKSDWSCEFYLKKIKEIKKVIKKIPDQPLVIEFSDGGIKIDYVYI